MTPYIPNILSVFYSGTGYVSSFIAAYLVIFAEMKNKFGAKCSQNNRVCEIIVTKQSKN